MSENAEMMLKTAKEFGAREIAKMTQSGMVTKPAVSTTNPITNNFNISQLVVREEADVGRIARELLRQQQLRPSYG